MQLQLQSHACMFEGNMITTIGGRFELQETQQPLIKHCIALLNSLHCYVVQ